MQNCFLWFMIFMILFVIPAQRATRHLQARIARKNRIKRKKGVFTMNELIKNYIGKEVIIYTHSSSGVTGTVTRIEDNWIEVEDKYGNKEAVNSDYISRIKEYPRNKKGKKKMVVA
ncbi:hypothetical protein [Ruminococcus sp.]|uniref:DUF6897 domain-containing protein n=1 Tax=Ruminococcus sp. TaxID=41978 RepID=UPI0025E06ECA|nr:hypothetical protein [Ruminococcus sp.]